VLEVVKAVITLNERRWPEMWGYVQRAHRILTETANKPSDHADIRADAMTFFILSLHLADWIVRDDSNGISKEQMKTDLDSSDAMRIGNDFANTSKHFGRDAGKGDDVRISEVTVVEGSAGHSTSAKIKYEKEGKQQTMSVLSLADGCLDWWKRYIDRNGLETGPSGGDSHGEGN
jgi:hypothetical protein